MAGTFVNMILVLAGGMLGLALRSRVLERLQKTMMQGLGLSVLLIGIQGALKETDLLAVILCIVTGGLLGEWIDIEKRLQSLGARAERLLARNSADGSFAKGFTSASLLFCVGAMSIVGPLESGLSGNHTTQIAKGIIDGVVAIFFAASFGPGVLLSAATIFVYQGGITLSASLVAPLLSDVVITQMSAVGGLLVAGIGLMMIVDAKIRIGNLLPAIFVPILYVPLSQWIG